MGPIRCVPPQAQDIGEGGRRQPVQNPRGRALVAEFVQAIADGHRERVVRLLGEDCIWEAGYAHSIQ